MPGHLYLANPVERQVMNRFQMTRIAGAVRLAGFYGLFTRPGGPRLGVAAPEPVVEPAAAVVADTGRVSGTMDVYFEDKEVLDEYLRGEVVKANTMRSIIGGGTDGND